MKSFRRIFGYVAIITVFLVIGYIVLFPQVWRCQTVRWSGFRALSGQVFVSEGTTKKQEEALLKHVATARQRLKAFWGSQIGDCPIIFCHNLEDYHRYCNAPEAAGCSLSTPIGSWIVLNKDGLNTDVIAHEMCHDELFSRLGWHIIMFDIPQWFDEGLALMLDYRFTNPDPRRRLDDYVDEWRIWTHHGQYSLTLQQIRTAEGFFGGDQRHVVRAYYTAGLEVAHWLEQSGQKGLLQLVTQVKDGRGFEEAYLQANGGNQ